MVMPRQMLFQAISGQKPMIQPVVKELPINDDQIQIASIDFRLGMHAYAMSVSSLPHGEKVSELIEKFKHYSFDLSFDKTHFLERKKTYIIPLLEQCSLPKDIHIAFSPKSSTGRPDVFTRVICDNHSQFDTTPAGYQGPLYLEVTPLSFHVLVKAGLTLVQGRLKSVKSRPLGEKELRRLHGEGGIVFDLKGKRFAQKDLRIEKDRFYFHINLASDIVGFRARPAIKPLDMTRSDNHKPEDFWEPIRRPKSGSLELQPDEFMLLGTMERVRIPPEVCGEILPFEMKTGEFRPHYAGFFDNGFGGAHGTTGVLEVRGLTLPFRLVHGQPLCAMVFEKTFELPSKLYEGHYKTSGPSLSKHFKDRYDAWNKKHWSHA